MVEFINNQQADDGANTGGGTSASESIGKVALFIVSDYLDKDTDDTGRQIVKILTDAGNTVVRYEIVPTAKEKISAALKSVIHKVSVNAIITVGGTGIAKDDSTVDVVRPMFAQELPSFASVLDKLAFVEVGTKCITSRPCAGVINKKPTFCLSGDPHSALIAVNSLIVPELPRLLELLK